MNIYINLYCLGLQQLKRTSKSLEADGIAAKSYLWYPLISLKEDYKFNRLAYQATKGISSATNGLGSATRTRPDTTFGENNLILMSKSPWSGTINWHDTDWSASQTNLSSNTTDGDTEEAQQTLNWGRARAL